jgi:hypothetical protein
MSDTNMSTPTYMVYSWAGEPVISIANAPLNIVDRCAEIANVGDLFLSVAVDVPDCSCPMAFILDGARQEARMFDSNCSAVKEFLGHLLSKFQETREPSRQAFQDIVNILDRLDETLRAAGVSTPLLANLSTVMKSL